MDVLKFIFFLFLSTILFLVPSYFNISPSPLTGYSWLPAAYSANWSNPNIVMGSSSVAAQEPTVIYDTNPVILTGYTHVFKCWYREGWTANGSAGVSYAESADGITWTQYSGNPVVSNGGYVISPSVYKWGNTYYLYVRGAADLMLWISSDGVNWSEKSSNLTGVPATLVDSTHVIGNNWIWKQSSTSYYMLIDYGGGQNLWNDYLFSSSDGITWTQQTSSPCYFLSGPWFAEYNGLYYGWGHYTVGEDGAGLPTDIGECTSTNLISWTMSPSNPVVTRAMVGSNPQMGNVFDNNSDQIGDPCLLCALGKIWIYFDAEPTGSINVKVVISHREAFNGTAQVGQYTGYIGEMSAPYSG